MRVSVMISACALFLLLMSSTSAQQVSPAEAEAMLARAVPRAGISLSRYLETRRAEFVHLDFDGDGAVTAADMERHREYLAASRRDFVIAGILIFDMDGDGTVTLEEILERVGSLVLPAAANAAEDATRRRQIEALIAEQMRADRDGNRRVDGAEMLAFAKERVAREKLNLNPIVAAALAFDADHDGGATLMEFLSAAERVFRAIDTDGDQTISKEEIEAHRMQGVNPH